MNPTYVETRSLSLGKTLKFLILISCAFSLGINSPKVMGTKSSCVGGLEFLLHLSGFELLTRRERKDA